MKRLEKQQGAWVMADAPEDETVLDLPHTLDLAQSAPDLAGVDAVRLDWPQFKLGQAFTQARLLRERHGFTGRLVAHGAIFRDQALYAARCGVDAFEIEEAEADGWRESLAAYDVFYQPAAAGTPAWHLRGGGRP